MLIPPNFCNWFSPPLKGDSIFSLYLGGGFNDYKIYALHENGYYAHKEEYILKKYFL